MYNTVNSKPPGLHYSRALIKSFVTVFLPLAVIVGIVTMIIYFTEARSRRIIIENQENIHIDQVKNIIAHDFQAVVSDLMILSDQHELQLMLKGDNIEKEDLAHNFLSYSVRKGLYDQIRFLDDTGMEVVRVNFNNGNPNIVPENQLQFKGNRYYFEDSFRLNHGEVYVSPFDLNIEQGEIEQPLKPMIRLGTPVFNSRGQKKGIILLNFLGEKLLTRLKQYPLGVPGMLLNSDGFWLKGPRSVDEWGFMYENRKNRTFGNAFPDAWKRIAGTESGQFHNVNGLFIFATIYPLKEAWQSSTGSGSAFEPSGSRLKGGEYYWKIVSRVSPGILNAGQRKVLNNLLILDSIIVLVLAAASFVIVRTGVRRKQAEERILKEKNFSESAINSLPGVFYLFDKKGHFLRWNKNLEEVSGYSEEEMKTLSPLDLFEGKGKRIIGEMIQEVFAKGSATAEANLISKYGEKTPYYFTGFRMIENSIPYLVGMGIDVTEHKRAEEELLRSQSELSVLYQVSSSIGRTIDIEKLLDIILKTITGIDIFNVKQKGGIFILEGNRMKLVSHLGHPEAFLDLHKNMTTNDCLCGLAARKGEIIISKNSAKDCHHTITYPGMVPHGHIIIPLKARDQVAGVLYLYLPPDFDIDEDKLKLLDAIGNQIGVAIDNARLYEETKKFSLQDPLTGLANRRCMNTVLERNFTRSKRLGSALSVIMLDIDYFKKYNDAYGHAAGDDLLAGISKVIIKETRGIDFVARYGGEEFLILLPDTELRMAHEAAERIRKSVEENTDVTISLGLFSFHKGIQTKEELINKADKALYKAKQKGRNRVEINE